MGWSQRSHTIHPCKVATGSPCPAALAIRSCWEASARAARGRPLPMAGQVVPTDPWRRYQALGSLHFALHQALALLGGETVVVGLDHALDRGLFPLGWGIFLLGLEVPLIKERHLFQRQRSHTLGIQLFEEAGGPLIEAIDATGIAPLAHGHTVGSITVEDGEGRADAAEVVIRPGLEGGQHLGGLFVNLLQRDAPREVYIQCAPGASDVTQKADLATGCLELGPRAAVQIVRVKNQAPGFQVALVDL
mmetsp:Transcript_2893/g.6599  ORF Transcript_2893/g.6599 Transcript_2893/m.6599 type:complete len:248 (+) Transcript_2893:424-1167(+)